MSRDLPFRRAEHDSGRRTAADRGERTRDRDAHSDGSSGADLVLPEIAIPEGAPGPEDLADRLPEYDGFRCIGAGAMGVVYEALHRPLDRHVAVKVLSTSLINRGVTVKRFFQEARAMARISHPNIVPVFEVAGDGALPYFTMELVRGGSLKELICAEGALAPRRAAEIACQVASALAHAHQEGILHRDVKPGNVLLTHHGVARLTDFGLVRRTDSVTITASDAIVGTPQYMSPEQVKGDSLDGRSDVFSLGSTLYELIIGKPPFESESPVGVLRAIVDNVPTSIRKLRPQIPASLEAVVMRMLEKDPDRRYPDMEAARADLQRYLDGEAVEATLPSSMTRAWRRLRSNRLALRFAAAFLILASLAAFYIYATESLLPEGNRYANLVNKAASDMRTGDWQAAGAALELLTDEEKRQPEILGMRAQVAQRTGKYEQALELCNQAIALDASNLEFRRLAVEAAYEGAVESDDPGNLFDRANNHLLAWEEALGTNAARTAEGLSALIHIESQRVAIRRSNAERSLRTAAELEGAVTPGPTGLPSFLTPLQPKRPAQRQLAHAKLEVGYGLDALDRLEAIGGQTLQTEIDRAFLNALFARLTKNPSERAAALRGSLGEIFEIRNRANFGNLPAKYQVDLPRYMLEMNQDLARADDGAQLTGEIEKWRMMYETTSSIVTSARDEVEGSFTSIVTPETLPVSGPLGKAKDVVGGLIGGIFGGAEEESDPSNP